MNKKLYVISVPIVLVPYLALFTLAKVFFSTKLPFFNYIMESVFNSNALYLIVSLLFYCILTGMLSIVCFFVSIYKKWDAISLAKTAMIMKLAQVPAYVLIFALGAVFVITIFTIPFSIGLFVIDCLSVFMTGLFVVSSVIATIKNNTFTLKEVIWVILLQFVFCADVISSVVFYIKLKRANKQQIPNNEFAPPSV